MKLPKKGKARNKKAAAGNSHLVARLRAGGDVTTRTLARIRTFMAEYNRGARRAAS